MMGFIFDDNASAPRFGTLDPATGIFTDTPGAGPYTGNAYALFAIGTGDTEPPLSFAATRPLRSTRPAWPCSKTATW